MPGTFALEMNCLIFGKARIRNIWSFSNVAINSVVQWEQGGMGRVGNGEAEFGLGGNNRAYVGGTSRSLLVSQRLTAMNVCN